MAHLPLQPLLAPDGTALFWYMSLAHWLGDFPLQSNWIAQHKTNFWVLALHVTIHFLLLLAILYPATVNLWPYLLFLAAIHFVIDASKNWIKLHRPAWVTSTYLGDQVFHLASLAGVAVWMKASTAGNSVALPLPLAIIACGLVLVTFAWMITEKVLWARIRGFMQDNPIWVWKRLALRAGFYGLMLIGRQGFFPVALALSAWLPYANSPDGKRAFLADVLVALIVSFGINLALPG